MRRRTPSRRQGCRDRDEMRADVHAVAERRNEPGFGAGGVGERLLRGEGFRRDHEQRRRRIERRKRAREVLGIDVGDERDVDALRLGTGAASRTRRLRQRGADEKRAEIRAADAEIDDGADGPARRADAQAAANLRRQRAHSRLRRADLGDDVAAVHDERRIARLPQRRVERGPALRLVDFLAGEERARSSPGGRSRRRERRGGGSVSSPSRSFDRSTSQPSHAKDKRSKRPGSRAKSSASVVPASARRASARSAGAAEVIDRLVARDAERSGGGHRSPQHSRSGRHCNTRPPKGD